MGDGRRTALDLSWSAITNEEGEIVRLMLCVRDVIELRAFAAKASEQRRRLDMIGKVFAISLEKFDGFMESASSFIGENERIIREHGLRNKKAIAELFRNLHTVKGNARNHRCNIRRVWSTRPSSVTTRCVRPMPPRCGTAKQTIEDFDREKHALQCYANVNEVSLAIKR